MESRRKTIALNTIYLYFGSFFQLIVGLYTSRALLQALGVEDFGIYGVVGGIIGLLSFINMAMGSASSRYITYELANGTLESQKRIFSVVFTVHIVIAILIFVLGETVGLWYVYNKLVVPDGRINAAHWVYQAAIFMSIINIIQVPYTASITAHERMGFLSFWNSLNIFLKLIVIFLLYLVKTDELIFYASLMSVTTFFIGIGYFIYCKYSFKECRLECVTNKALFKEVLSFAGYNAFSSLANAMRTEGTSLLINRFFGVTLNAAGSIAAMVSGYIMSFTANIITAFRPQIVKSYAIADYRQMEEYMLSCTVYCVGAFALIAVPIFLKMDYVLNLWLGIVPDYAATFCRIALIGSVFGLLNMIIIIAIQATSKVKKNSISISVLSMVSIFILYFFFMLKMAPYVAYIISVLVDCSILLVSLLNIKRLIPVLSLRIYMNKLIKLFLTITIAAVLTYYVSELLPLNILGLLITTFSFCIFFTLFFYRFILTYNDRFVILSKFQNHYMKSDKH